jgi:hypothetical protein
MWTNYLQLETPKCSWPPFQSQTSSDHHKPRPHTNHTQVHHPQILTTACACQPPKSWKNLGSYQETIGTAMSRAWCHSTHMPSQDWEGEWWKPLSIGTTSFPTTPNFSCHGDATASVTRAHLGQEKTHIPIESSQARRPIPSSLGKCSPRWSTLPSDKKGTRPCVLRCNAFEVLMTGSETWLKTSQTSKSCIMTCSGKNITPYAPWPVPTLSATLSHTSSTMPR